MTPNERAAATARIRDSRFEIAIKGEGDESR